MFNSTRTVQRRLEKQIQDLSQALDSFKADASRHVRDNPLHTLKNQAQSSWEHSQEQLEERYKALTQLAGHYQQQANACVREHPVSSALVGAGVCLLIGWLLFKK